MSNDANRTFIVLVAAAWIVIMAVLIFFTWSADTDVIDRIGDFQEYLSDHNDDAGKLIVTLSALVTVVIALLIIIVEVAPEDEERELRVEQAGATTIVPAGALRQRLEEALIGIPEVTAAKARVSTKDKGIVAALDVTLLPNANVAAITQEAARVVIDTVQTDLGLPVVGMPTVKISFASGAQPIASSVAQEPVSPTVTPQDHPEEPMDERLENALASEERATTQAYNPWSPPPAPPTPPSPPADTPWSSPAPAPEPESPPAEQPGEREEPQP
jgi:hypothetical protein